MGFLYTAPDQVSGRHSPRAKPRDERRRPADPRFQGRNAVNQQNGAESQGNRGRENGLNPF